MTLDDSGLYVTNHGPRSTDATSFDATEGSVIAISFAGTQRTFGERHTERRRYRRIRLARRLGHLGVGSAGPGGAQGRSARDREDGR
jgi:hypothetical protein